MREYKTIERKQIWLQQISRKCNKCGVEIVEDKYIDRECGINAYTETRYPIDAGDNVTEGWKVSDLCDDCTAWLKTILIENGVTIENQ